MKRGFKLTHGMTVPRRSNKRRQQKSLACPRKVTCVSALVLKWQHTCDFGCCCFSYLGFILSKILLISSFRFFSLPTSALLLLGSALLSLFRFRTRNGKKCSLLTKPEVKVHQGIEVDDTIVASWLGYVSVILFGLENTKVKKFEPTASGNSL